MQRRFPWKPVTFHDENPMKIPRPCLSTLDVAVSGVAVGLAGTAKLGLRIGLLRCFRNGANRAIVSRRFLGRIWERSSDMLFCLFGYDFPKWTAARWCPIKLIGFATDRTWVFAHQPTIGDHFTSSHFYRYTQFDLPRGCFL